MARPRPGVRSSAGKARCPRSGPLVSAAKKGLLSIQSRASGGKRSIGPRGGDEFNTPEAGKNCGWPVIVHGIDYPGTTIGQGISEKAGLEQPRY
jgi:hypothetical protein